VLGVSVHDGGAVGGFCQLIVMSVGTPTPDEFTPCTR
jgi:hypothetical protein